MDFPDTLHELANKILNESLSTDYFIQKTTDDEVKDLLLRGHYLGAWPFAGSRYKDFIYGIYRKPTKTSLSFNDVSSKNVLVGCVVYGYAEHHAARYIQDWVRSFLSSNETSEKFAQVIQLLVKKDEQEQQKAQERGYEYKPKLKMAIQSLLKTINIQQKEIIELKRLYILPEHDEKNIESFAIGQANNIVLTTHPEINVIVSFSDSRVGHHGGIYQATNAAFAGFTKHGLLRYVYFRPNLAETLKKYQTQFQNIISKYPKQTDIKKKPKMNWDFEKDPESNKKVIKYLKNTLVDTGDAAVQDAIKKVIDHIEKSKQMGFSFAR